MTHHPHDRFREDVDLRQRNTVWPDTLQNAAKVDGFIWKGSPTATGVQRVGILIWGIVFLVMAYALLSLLFLDQLEPASIVVLIFAFGAAYVGHRLVRNAFRH